jgi:hypothetical protein
MINRIPPEELRTTPIRKKSAYLPHIVVTATDPIDPSPRSADQQNPHTDEKRGRVIDFNA